MNSAFSEMMACTYSMKISMTPVLPCNDELEAIRHLEKTVQACGLPTTRVSGQVQRDMLSSALKKVTQARAA